MEVDAPLAQHTSDSNLIQQQEHHPHHPNLQRISPSDYQSEASMNFDYLQDLRAGASSSAAGSRAGAGGNGGSNSYGLVDDSRTLDRPYNANERFVNIIDQMDARVEKLRKDALNLQEKKDYLLMSIDLIKSNEMMQNMSEAEREEIMLYIQRVSSRLGTVELNVRTVRDNSQEDSLSQINALIDTMIKMGDPVIARQRCQLYLNACCSSSMDPSGYMDTVPEADVGPIDKKFESALLGCTLDDQKNIKKRLQALMGYLNKQTVSH
ncbi:BAG family molecular chaperone regulator 2 isoform X1 [Drosophila bipectinata]|uniref:BAG family molecular chaperone regulator 2 isoform X1 n=1 Tax=Drosophila bipectinata TaxID=42026 RepID=UPI001C8B0936|nr:BAG family molecular chaperone regulator 2 isoform X1 [Drosophila bipectinata]XP_043067920.1 BAG family molecular chaperone regulator 2 isoform X1 [Drosophila bipectinata]